MTIQEVKQLDKDSYQIIDIRDDNEIAHGAIPGAVALKVEEIAEIVAAVISNCAAISPADMLPSFSNVRMSRRTGSDKALKVSANPTLACHSKCD